MVESSGSGGGRSRRALHTAVNDEVLDHLFALD